MMLIFVLGIFKILEFFGSLHHQNKCSTQTAFQSEGPILRVTLLFTRLPR